MAPLPPKPPRTKRKGPHPHQALSAAFCRTVAEAGRYCDGDGLYLHVEPSGAKRWVQRLVIRGTSCTLGLGSYKLVSLSEARELALANRKLARSGGDPKADRARTRGVPTFAEAAETVIAIHGETWKHPERMKTQWRGCLRDHAYPRIGGKGVDQMTTADVMAVLLPLWTRRHATARKLRQRISAIMKWAVAQGYRNDNPTGDAITAALPKRANHVRHLPALPHGEVAGAIATVKASSAWAGTKLCFEFMVLTAVRPGEARGARWEEIDFDAAVWTIPAARMKATREHRVPLSARAVEVLHAAERLRTGSTAAQCAGLVFPSARGKQLADARLSKLLDQLGIGAVPHGFRSSFRDWASERTSHPREVVEAALAHVVRNQTEAAYARSDLFDPRRPLMDDWMQYIDPARGRRAAAAAATAYARSSDQPASMNATTSKKLYEAQLKEDLEPPVQAHVDRRATWCMLYFSRRMPAGELQEATPGRIWIWSDLHLGHTTTISSFARPFANAAEMDDALFRSWHRAVNPGDTIICLGDVAIDGLSGTLLERLRSAPGHKVLVIGNHEVNRAGNVDIDGFDEIHSTLYAPGDPPLLLTHMPLRNVPDGCVNVHGHLHDRKSPSRTHHINVSIEQLRYRPRPWEAICRLARHMAAGDTLSGRTTAQRLTSLP